MKKYIIALILMGAIALPGTASAAWWNPLKWFSRSEVTQEEGKIEAGLSERISEFEKRLETSESVSDARKEVEIKEVVIEKPVEKVVTQTITVDNPELQGRINALILERDELKRRVRELEEKVLYLEKENNNPQQKYYSESSHLIDFLEELVEEREALIKKIEDNACPSKAYGQSVNGVWTVFPSCDDIIENIGEIEKEEDEVKSKINLLRLRYGIPVISN